MRLVLALRTLVGVLKLDGWLSYSLSRVFSLSLSLHFLRYVRDVTFDLAVAPKTCPEGSVNNLGFGFCPYNKTPPLSRETHW
jgi:hypothetical protein